MPAPGGLPTSSRPATTVAKPTEFDPDTHRERWRALDTRHRRTILRAVNRGQTLGTPADAMIAVGVAQGQKRFWKWAWVLGPIVALVALRNGVAAFATNAIVATVILGAMSFFWFRRADRAEAANLAVATAPRGKRGKGGGQRLAGGRGHLPGSGPNPNTSKKKLKRRS